MLAQITRTWSFSVELIASIPWPRLGLGIFLLLVVSSLFVIAGLPAVFLMLLIVATLFFLAWHFSQALFYIVCFFLPLTGWLVPLRLWTSEWSERLVAASIDLTLGEWFSLVLLLVWAVRMLVIWKKRDRNWKPWLPLVWPFCLFVLANILSIFSSAMPDPWLVIKYSLRPVLIVYLTCVVLPANFIRSERHLMIVVKWLAILGIVFSFDGLRSLVVFSDVIPALHRARPLPWFGFFPHGGNHNALAELLLFTMPLSIIIASRVSGALKHFWHVMAGLMVVVALLTFARTAWLVFFAQFIFVFFLIKKKRFLWNSRKLLAGALLFLPLVISMIFFSLRPEIQGSNDSRAMLLSISWFLFREHPLVGAGAGTTVVHVGKTEAFTIDYGEPLDAHGMWQKIAGETGGIGIAAFLLLLTFALREFAEAWKSIRSPKYVTTFLLFLAAAFGAFTYQQLSTDLWSPKLWLPIGLALAAGRVFFGASESRDPDFLLFRHA